MKSVCQTHKSLHVLLLAHGRVARLWFAGRQIGVGREGEGRHGGWIWVGGEGGRQRGQWSQKPTKTCAKEGGREGQNLGLDAEKHVGHRGTGLSLGLRVKRTEGKHAGQH